MNPRVSVLMPTYNQAHFIRRAIDSLCAQTLSEWELIIVDDGATDDTAHVVEPYLADARIQYRRLEKNVGRGAALNCALEEARAPLIAYLPSDDVYYPEHLSSLADLLDSEPSAVLAFSGVRHHYNRTASGKLENSWLQMVQVMHRASPARWLERHELVSDDLERLFWNQLEEKGSFLGSGAITCEWVAHAEQLHKLIQEPVGGINTYRARFDVPYPLRFHSTEGNFIDEVTHYRQFRERPDTPLAPDGLKILLVGELAYNPERVLALEEAGHRLYGLWMPDPYWYNSVGPVPFGHVTDVPRERWQAAIEKIQPDIIYGLLNWQAVPFAWEVLQGRGNVPFVWHFKEGPFICLEKGTWSQLVDLHWQADGQIFCSPEMQAWYETAMPGVTQNSPTLILDGDLPKQEWFAGERSPRLSDTDGEIHTVVPGRPIGLHPHTVAELAEQGIHLHFYGNFTHKQWKAWIERTLTMAPDHLHLHDQVDQGGWVAEFSQYDAGWLHWMKSENGGDIRRANWDDLNYPARITTLVAAGLPLLQYDNRDAVVATQTLGRSQEISILFSSIAELGEQMRDTARLRTIQANVWRQRRQFTFDYHVDRLVAYFRRVIAEVTP